MLEDRTSSDDETAPDPIRPSSPGRPRPATKIECGGDGRETFLASCRDCKTPHCAYVTVDGTVLPMGLSACKSCNGEEFEALTADTGET